MSEVLEKLIRIPSLQSPAALSKFQSQFLHSLSNKINQIAYTKLSIYVSRSATSPLDAIKLLEQLKSELPSLQSEQSLVLFNMEISRRMIQNGQLEEIKEKLNESRTIIDRYSGVMATEIYSLFYLAHLEYHKVKGTPQEYFSNAMLYLTYTPLNEIEPKQQIQLAQDISLSALLGAQIYNFGEFLQHPILNLLKESDSNTHTWIPTMLNQFNQGDIAGFEQLFTQIKSQNPLLNMNSDFLHQKIRIMALIELIFQKTNEVQSSESSSASSTSNEKSGRKTLTFTEISSHCKIEVSAVEVLLMKALSLHVIKGIINEIEQNFRIKWVQPRVLNSAQIGQLKTKLHHWSAQVDQAIVLVQNNAEQIINPLLA